MASFLNAEKWQSLIKNATNVLRIHICVVNSDGTPVIIPDENRYGWKFSPHLFAIESNFENITEGRFELIDRYQFHYYAVACGAINKSEGYIVIGPVILNKRLNKEDYQKITNQYKDNFDEFIERLEDIRIISHINLETILNTIDGLIRIGQENLISIVTERTKLTRAQAILKSMLQMALVLTNAESGSVMLFDGKTKELSIDAAKGIDPAYINKRIKLHEGISGIVFQENKTMILKGQSQNSRVHELLKRANIKESIVMPFQTADKRTRGVLNLNIMSSRTSIKGGLERLYQTLQQMTSSVLEAI